jgi:hypothetical protein
MGDMPDFESMSEEEQMRWLESLAKRQGADEGFTTSADLDVPEVDPDSAVIDEPGYTPFSDSSSSAAAPPPQTSAPQEPISPEPLSETDAVSSEPPPLAAEPAMASAGDEADYDGLVGDDPMAWLESLAKRQGAEEGFTTAADLDVPEIDPDSVVIDEPGYTPYYESAATQPTEVPQPPYTEPTVQETPAAPVDEQPPEYEAPPPPVDEEPEPEPVPEAPVADVPVAEEAPEYEAPPAPEPPEVEPEPISETPVMDVPVADDVPAEAVAAMPGEGDLPADIDPMAWLESLAKRQGAHEGFTTSADIEVPEVDPDSVIIDEPGYTPYSSTATTGRTSAPQAEEELEPEAEPVAPSAETVAEQPTFEDLPEEETAEDWLTGLAEEPETDVGEFLEELSDTDYFPAVDQDIEFEPEIDEEAVVDLGMSDEEIAQAQAEGTITPEQELAWLQSKVTAAPDEAIDFDQPPEDVGPAEPAEMPDWLAAQRPSEEELDAIDEKDVVALEMPLEDSLLEEDFDLDDLVGMVDEFDIEADEAEPAPVIEGEDTFDASQLLEGYTPEADEWAQAIDQDLEIENLEAIPEPDWYTQAMARADEDAAQLEASVVGVFEEDITGDDTTQLPVSDSDSDLPDWLQGVETTVVEEDPDLPEWLRVSPTGEADEVTDWLFEQQVGGTPEATATDIQAEPTTAPVIEPEPVLQPKVPEVINKTASIVPDLPADDDEWLARAQTGPIPSWYPYEVPAESVEVVEPVVQEQAPSPAPEPIVEEVVPQPVQEQPAPQPPPQPEPAQQAPAPPTPAPASVTTSDQADFYRARLHQNPEDHDSRLNLARELNRAGSLSEGLQEYEVLIDKSAMLEKVADDLGGLIKQIPRHPKARRLLGDIYMRQGRLQEALDTYRGALDQI